MKSVGLLKDRVCRVYATQYVLAFVAALIFSLLVFVIVEQACCSLSSPQGSEGHNTNLHAVPNDAVSCLSVCGMCVRERLHNGLAEAFF